MPRAIGCAVATSSLFDVCWKFCFDVPLDRAQNSAHLLMMMLYCAWFLCTDLFACGAAIPQTVWYTLIMGFQR